MCAPCLYQSSYRDAVRTVVILSAEMGRHSAGENDLVHSVWCTPCGAHRVVPAIWFTLWFSEFELTIIMFAPSQASFKSRPNAIRHLNLYSSLHVAACEWHKVSKILLYRYHWIGVWESFLIVFHFFLFNRVADLIFYGISPLLIFIPIYVCRPLHNTFNIDLTYKLLNACIAWFS